jgi:magnesium-transporting ATPase (P-type)
MTKFYIKNEKPPGEGWFNYYIFKGYIIICLLVLVLIIVLALIVILA